MKIGIKKAKKYFGTQYKVAIALGVAQSQASYWNKSYMMSPRLALKCEKKTKGFVRRYELNEIAYPPVEYKQLWPLIAKIHNYKEA